MSQDNKPAERGVYAFHKIKLGEFLLFLDEDELKYNFMQLPDRYEYALTKKDFIKAIKEEILVFAEALPIEVYEVSVANILKKS